MGNTMTGLATHRSLRPTLTVVCEIDGLDETCTADMIEPAPASPRQDGLRRLSPVLGMSIGALDGVARKAGRSTRWIVAAALALAALWPTSAGAVTLTESTSGANAGAIALGPDSHEWFGRPGSAQVARVAAPFGSTPTYVALPAPTARARALTDGPDGNVWYLDWARAKLGRITPAGVVTEFADGQVTAPDGTTTATAGGITAGPDGNLWYVANASHAVFRMTPAGVVTPFSANLAANAGPVDITAGPDGKLWFLEQTANKVGRITTTGTITEFSANLTANAGLAHITAGADGNLWFTEPNPGDIGRIDTSGAIHEFPVSASADPEGIAAGPDGFVWFTDTLGGAIGRITPGGTATEYASGLTAGAAPSHIAPGPDGGLWFSGLAGGRLGHATTDAPSATTGGSSAITDTSATLDGQIDARGHHTLGHFEYGLTARYGQRTADQDAGSGSGPQAIVASLSGLTPDTTYHYRLVAAGDGGTGLGADRTFPTGPAVAPPPPPPSPHAVEGAVFSGVVAHFDLAPKNPTIDWGDRTPPSSGIVTAAAGGGYDVSGDHTYAEEGSDAIRTTAGSQAITTQAAVADAPIYLGASRSVGFVAGDTEAQPIELTGLVDANPGETAGAFIRQFTVSIGWGDGSSSPGRVFGDFRKNASGLLELYNFHVEGSHAYADPNGAERTITVTVKDPGGASATTTVHASIVPPPVPERGLCPDNHSPTGDFWEYKTPERTTNPLTHAAGVTETITMGATNFFQATAFTCWEYLGYSDRGHQSLGARGPIELNGFFLVPVNSSDPPELVIDTGGLVTATGNDTRYDIVVRDPNNPTGTRLTIGRVDLRTSPFSLENPPEGGHFGFFGPSPNGPTIGHHPINRGEITIPPVRDRTAGADITADITLPRLFASDPNGGAPPTAELNYHTGAVNQDASGAALGGTICNTCKNPKGPAPIRYTSADRGRGPLAHTADVSVPGLGGQHYHLDLPQIFLGALKITHAFLDYDPAKDIWSGGGDLALGAYTLQAVPPPPNRGVGMFGDGRFAFGGAALDLGYPGVPLFPAVTLQEIGVTFAVDPTRFTGDATINAFGGLVQIHGGVLVVFGNDHYPYNYEPGAIPGVDHLQTGAPIKSFAAGVGATVNLQVQNIGRVQLASGYAMYISPAYFEFAGHIDLNILQVLALHGDLQGAIDFDSGRYDLQGSLRVCANFPYPVNEQCLGMMMEVSSKGIGGCGDFLGWHPGARYEWGGEFKFFLAGCDLGPIHVDVRPATVARARAAGATLGVDVPPGLSGTSLIVHGTGGPPRIVLTGPNGEKLTSDPDPTRGTETSQFLLLPMKSLNETLIGIKHPSAGRWTVAQQTGSAAIASIEHADNLPPAHISATVTGHGRALALHYAVRPRAGQTVQFAERAGSVFHILGHATGTAGTFRFTPAIAAAGPRNLVAIVSLSGVPAHDIIAGRYTAPGPPRAGRPTHLRIARRGSSIVIGWRPSSDSTGYLATVTLSDRRRLSLSTKRGRHMLELRQVAPELGASVRVMGVGPDGNTGPAALARLARIAPPSRVTTTRVARTRTGVVVTWRRSVRASRYLVRITLVGPSRRPRPVFILVTTRPTLGPSRTLAGLKRGTTARLSIRAVSAGGQIGAAGTASWRGRS